MLNSLCATGNLLGLVRSHASHEVKSLLLLAFDKRQRAVGNSALPYSETEEASLASLSMSIPTQGLEQLLRVYLNTSDGIVTARLSVWNSQGVQFARHQHSKRDAHVCFFDKTGRRYARIVDIIAYRHQTVTSVAALVKPFRTLGAALVEHDPYVRWSEVAGQLFDTELEPYRLLSFEAIRGHASFREYHDVILGQTFAHLMPLDKVDTYFILYIGKLLTTLPLIRLSTPTSSTYVM